MEHRWILPLVALPAASLLAQHAVLFAMVVLFPLWDRYEIPRLKASTDPEKRVRFYRRIMAVEWTATLVVWLAVGVAALFTMRVEPGEISWLQGSAGRSLVLGLLTGIALALVVPAILAIWSNKVRTTAAKAAQRLSYLVPSTSKERLLWWPLCLTAGICEEFLYRGFLLRYLHVAPFHLSLTWALVVAAIVFGIGHLYQGWRPALGTVVLGFALGLLFVLTGSLLIPMIAHALLDLRALLLLPEGWAAASAPESA